MFHTPPTRNDWKESTAIQHSYHVSNSSSIDTYKENIHISNNSNISLEKEVTNDPLEPINQKIDSLSLNADLDSTCPKSPALTFENDDGKVTKHFVDENIVFSNLEKFGTPSKAQLPSDLAIIYDQFLKELREPKFERSLAVFEISELFQKFYTSFKISVDKYLNKETDLIIGKNKAFMYYEYNLLLERLLCDTFYTKLTFPLKGLETDIFEKEISDKFCHKLSCLGFLDIQFKNLDIDLPYSIEKEFLNQLLEKVLPEFELMTTQTSPTLKATHLVEIHNKIGEIIKNLTSTINNGKNYTLNTDIYLPILIYTVIKLKDLTNHFLVTQLFLIKRFSNQYIFEMENFQLSEERGKLLYVCANFEACLSYIASATLENLNIDYPNENKCLLPGSELPRDYLINLLVTPISLSSIDEEILKFKQINPIFSKDDSKDLSNNWVDYAKINLPGTMVNADQGLKSIGNVVDNSLRHFMGKVSWLGAVSSEDIFKNSNEKHENNDELMRQLEENDAFKKEVVKKDVVTPTSSFSSETRELNEENQTPFPLSNNDDMLVSESTEVNGPRSHRVSSTQEKILNKISSMGEVMKNLRPNSASSSTISLNAYNSNDIFPLNRSSSGGGVTSPLKMRQNGRSRTASFISNTLFGSPQNGNQVVANSSTKDNRGGSFFGSIETAFGNVRSGRSRGNSLSDDQRVAATGVSEIDHHIKQARLLEDIARFKRFKNKFEDMSIVELMEMYENYQYIMTHL